MESINITLYIANKIKQLREKRNITQQELAEALGTTQQSIARYESGERKTDNNMLFALSDYFNISINEFFPPLHFDNAKVINISNDTIQIPVLGTIKAGIAIEAQEDIIEYIDIPKDWTKGGKTYYGLQISGDSMSPKYQEKDIVIFEKSEDFIVANGKDCAVMVNGFDATFKNVRINQTGIQLIPLNINNSDGYEPTFFDSEQIQSLPVRIIGIAKEKRTRL